MDNKFRIFRTAIDMPLNPITIIRMQNSWSRYLPTHLTIIFKGTILMNRS